MLGAWGLLYFLMSYNIVSEFDSSKIIRLFGMVPRHMQKKNTIELCKGLGISDRITDLIDYLIGKGQHLDVFHLANVFNLTDKYPLLSLLRGYIETAKQTSVEIQSKSLLSLLEDIHQSVKDRSKQELISAIPKETTNLWVAHHLVEKKITDSSQRSIIMAEIKVLLNGYARKKNGAKACTSNSQPQQKQDNKKRKKAEHELHKGQENMQQGEQSKAREQDHKQNNQQQKPHEEESQMRESEQQQQQKNRPQEMQQHLKRPRPCTVKLPTPAVPMILNVGQMGHLGRPPFSAMPGGPSYAAQPGWPGAGGAPPFAPPFGAAQYIRPFNPFYPHPQFYPSLSMGTGHVERVID
ncbi:hypothetical protein EJB05_05815 [Eragrostis curvula]|uniref:FRIGIDA-like protein n=1 Tax=Eragrostis curvula TaxID=38414 RepID=A0A5J9WD54_9POAL|nr:hypothetical protein EJB05_05815 [Eragrostis curvula]